MNDPWDVKSVRQSDQYVSCMKINGVPLLPPVLSKECRKEMQYYKLLAREVEKRISNLKIYIDGDSDSSDDKTDAPELTDCEQSYAVPSKEMEAGYNVVIDKITAVTTEQSYERSPTHPASTDVYNCITVKTTEKTSVMESPQYVIDLSLSINDNGKNDTKNNVLPPSIEFPERDYDSPNKHPKELILDCETTERGNQKEKNEDLVNFSFDSVKDPLSDPIPDISYNRDGPSSLSAKSFTGSLIDLHKESVKGSQVPPKLIRQSSYTVLKPSPQLLAHLEVQSMNEGVEMTSISMSESLSNLASNKKRRSWDLESAKVKWSSMALELKHKNLPNNSKTMKANKSTNKHIARSVVKKTPQNSSPPRTHSMTPDKSGLNSKTITKSDQIQKSKNVSYVKNTPSNRTLVKETISPSIKTKLKEHVSTVSKIQKKEISPVKHAPALVSGSEDPATRVRELYEKIQNQQLIQMTNLMEKQKREQLLLQQVFEEQNNILFKQLKTIAPKATIEVKRAWGGDASDAERGPVSLSQLINHEPPDRSVPSDLLSPISNTNHYINFIDDALKKSRDISSNIKSPQIKSRTTSGNKTLTPNSPPSGSRTRTHSPVSKNTSRKLKYDSSASSPRDCDTILTDRTNDTFADLNVTFPSDNSDDCQSLQIRNNPQNIQRLTPQSILSHCISSKETTVKHRSPVRSKAGPLHRSTDNAIRNLEDTIQNSMNSMFMPNGTSIQSPFRRVPTSTEQAAATKIVAYAKGYLTRRLMRTERVQGTVQTIRDALLCALQLHQDREGIRGADVDLHRRLIQQITAACYSLHETFVAGSAAERCAVISADRERRRALAARQPTPPRQRNSDVMSQSHSGSFPTRNKRPSAASLMTQSNYETFNGGKCGAARSRYMPSPRRRPWR